MQQNDGIQKRRDRCSLTPIICQQKWEIGREAQCVDTIDFFLIQPERPGCQAHNMAIRDVWI